MANIVFYVNVILIIFRIPVFIIAVEKCHGSIIASPLLYSFNLDLTTEYDVFAYFFQSWLYHADPRLIVSSERKNLNS